MNELVYSISGTEDPVALHGNKYYCCLTTILFDDPNYRKDLISERA